MSVSKVVIPILAILLCACSSHFTAQNQPADTADDNIVDVTCKPKFDYQGVETSLDDHNPGHYTWLVLKGHGTKYRVSWDNKKLGYNKSLYTDQVYTFTLQKTTRIGLPVYEVIRITDHGKTIYARPDEHQ